MKIIVNVAMKQDDIIKTVEAIEGLEAKFVEKKGLKLYFEVNESQKDPAAYVKKVLKAVPQYGALYYAVENVK